MNNDVTLSGFLDDVRNHEMTIKLILTNSEASRSLTQRQITSTSISRPGAITYVSVATWERMCLAVLTTCLISSVVKRCM